MLNLSLSMTQVMDLIVSIERFGRLAHALEHVERELPSLLHFRGFRREQEQDFLFLGLGIGVWGFYVEVESGTSQIKSGTSVCSSNRGHRPVLATWGLFCCERKHFEPEP